MSMQREHGGMYSKDDEVTSWGRLASALALGAVFDLTDPAVLLLPPSSPPKTGARVKMTHLQVAWKKSTGTQDQSIQHYPRSTIATEY